jgi:hypothetical protein
MHAWSVHEHQEHIFIAEVKRAKFVAILFVALAVRFNILVNICHLLSYYFLELLPIFDHLNTSVLPHFTQI